MVGLGWSEILILLVCGVIFVIGPLVVVVVILIARERGKAPHGSPIAAPVPQSTPPLRPPPPPIAASDDADVRQTIIARLTHRFCPQCKAPLAADAPEGLCPACLMAGGLASAVIEPPVNGLAVTTPPSGSQPPATGEWRDLAQYFPELDIIELLGRGGMGTVYKARQRNLDRLVALKVIPPDAAKDPAFTERFNREAKAMARLNHSNIVTVYDFGERHGIYFLLMEYVDGVNLRHALRAGHLAPREALAIVPQVCDALQFAHDQGIVHRDIKPENVLLDRTGRVKIADFGLAKLLGKGPDDFTLTHTQQVMGTPRYMAPEQIERPSAVDHRADIYSLGVVLYEMLTGELPLGRFDPPSHKVEVDVRIDQVVLRALEKAPERRYQRASEIKTELASAASWPAPTADGSHAAVSAVQAPRRNESPPTWHTPSPATKFEFWDPAQPGGVPLRYVLGVALGMVMGVLMITAGVAAGIYGLVNFPGLSGGWWGWMGAAFGSVVGGFGSTAGSYNTYRQMTGAEDLLRSPRVTWFDWVMRGYLAVGLVLIGAAFIDYPDGDPSPISSWPALLLGGVATFQASLFLLWRMLIRPAAAAGEHLATSAERDLPADPSYLRAVVWPTLAMAAVFAVLLADVHFALPVVRPMGGITAKMIAYRQWYETIIVTAFVVVPLCALILGVWRTWGPRRQGADGRWSVPFPFAQPAWSWAVALLAGLSLFLPWFHIDLSSGARVLLDFDDVYSPTYDQRSGDSNASDTAAVVPTEAVLQNIAATAGGGRYTLRGLQALNTAAMALLMIFAATLSACVFPAANPGRFMVLLVAGLIVLLLATATLHDAANTRPRIVVDEVTATGLYDYAVQARGSNPRTIEPWRAAMAPAIAARPTIGAFSMLAACGLALFLAVTELSWATALPAGVKSPAQPAATLTPAKAAETDPARAAALAKLAGPGIGLIVVGVLGFAPLVLALLAIPAWTLTPMPVKSISREPTATMSKSLPKPARSGQSGLLLAAPGTLSIGGRGPVLPIVAAQVESYPVRSVGMMAPLMFLAVVLNLAFSITVIIGGWQMRQARSYGLALIAAILALLPCTFGWILGLPIGIWALFVLMEPEVKAAFR